MAHSGSLSRRNFLTAAAVAAGSTFLPTRLKALSPQDPVVNTVRKDGKLTNREKVSWKRHPVPIATSAPRRGPVQSRNGSRPQISPLASA